MLVRYVGIFIIPFQVALLTLMIDIQCVALMRACASSENQYFDSPTNGALNDAFGRIGAYISKLRLAE